MARSLSPGRIRSHFNDPGNPDQCDMVGASKSAVGCDDVHLVDSSDKRPATLGGAFVVRKLNEKAVSVRKLRLPEENE